MQTALGGVKKITETVTCLDCLRASSREFAGGTVARYKKISKKVRFDQKGEAAASA